jgi:hypothetical protein
MELSAAKFLFAQRTKNVDPSLVMLILPDKKVKSIGLRKEAAGRFSLAQITPAQQALWSTGDCCRKLSWQRFMRAEPLRSPCTSMLPCSPCWCWATSATCSRSLRRISSRKPNWSTAQAVGSGIAVMSLRVLPKDGQSIAAALVRTKANGSNANSASPPETATKSPVSKLPRFAR